VDVGWCGARCLACAACADAFWNPEHGDLPRPLPKVPEIDASSEVFECTGPKWWDYDAQKKSWGWTRPPPASQKSFSDEARPAGVIV
jgi:hypothetical protein